MGTSGVGPAEQRPLVAIAALYGAGGEVVGARAAERLDVEFLDRSVPQSIAAWSGLPSQALAQVTDEPRPVSDWFASTLGRLSTVTGEAGGAMERLDLQQRDLRAQIEERVARTRDTGGVVLGNGGTVILAKVPWALHVYLRGSPDARARQAEALDGIDAETAAQRRKRSDDALHAWVRQAYRADIDDPALYHLVLDSTALSLETCTDLIVAAARERVRAHRPEPAP